MKIQIVHERKTLDRWVEELHEDVVAPSNVYHGKDAQRAAFWKAPGGAYRQTDSPQNLETPFEGGQEILPRSADPLRSSQVLGKQEVCWPFNTVKAFLYVCRAAMPVYALCQRQLDPALNLKPYLCRFFSWHESVQFNRNKWQHHTQKLSEIRCATVKR